MSTVIVKSFSPPPVESTEATVSPLRIIKLLLLITAIVVAVVTGILGYQKWLRWKQGAAFREYVTNVDTLFVALQQYKDKIGTYPAGTNLEIAQALSGKNDKSRIIVIPTKMPANSKGEFVDAWGTPVRIYFTTPGVLIRSAGEDKVFEDARAKTGDDVFLSN